MTVYLIGTLHTDYLYGPEKLEKMYQDLAPDVLLTELNEADLGIKDKMVDALKKVENVSEFREEFLDFIEFAKCCGWEPQFNKDYGNRNRLPVHLIDLPGTGMYMEIIRRVENGDLQLRDEHKGFFNYILQMKERSLDPAGSAIYWYGLLEEQGSLWYDEPGNRDDYMAIRIREIYEEDLAIAYPVGMAHCVRDLAERTLVSKLDGLKFEVIPLI